MAAAHALAITSGKGGVGKSVIALNLAVTLARAGRRVLLVDADLGLGNSAVLLGVSSEYTLEDVLAGRCRVEEAVVSGPEGMVLLPAASDMNVAFWDEAEIDAEIGSELREFEMGFDFVLIDTGAGIAAKSVDFVAAAAEALLIVTPEPTAIADAYATLKVLHQRGGGLELGLLVNMADSATEATDLHEKFQEMALRFLGAEIDNRGYIPLDRYVREAVKRQIPFVLASPPTPATEAIGEVAGVLLDREGISESGRTGLFARALQQRNWSKRAD